MKEASKEGGIKWKKEWEIEMKTDIERIKQRHLFSLLFFSHVTVLHSENDEITVSHFCAVFIHVICRIIGAIRLTSSRYPI